MASPPAAGQSTPPADAPPSAVADTVRLAPATPAEILLTSEPDSSGERWSLARCIQTALEKNVDVRGASARRQQASGSALSGWGGILPTISTGASYTQVRPDKYSSFRGVTVDTTLFTGLAKSQTFGTLSATASSNIISAPAISEKIRRDHLRYGSELDEVETRNQVVFFVKQQYFVLLKAERLAQVARDTEKLARDEETRSEALFQVGTVARGDVLKARAHRASTQADRLTAENQVEIQASKLRQLIGVSRGRRISPDPVIGEGFVIPDSADAIRQALKARPGLESAKAIEKAARSGLFSAKAERLPKITGQLGVDRSKTDETIVNLSGAPNPPAEVVTTRYSTTWSGTLAASLPIFNGFALEGGVRQAKGALIAAESQRRQRELDVEGEVQQAWLLLREAIQRIDVAREGLASAEEDYKFSKGRYDLGAGTYLDLLTSEVGLATARQSLVEALADARIAEAGLEFAIGAKRY
jgi:outer membrane protein TolC